MGDLGFIHGGTETGRGGDFNEPINQAHGFNQQIVLVVNAADLSGVGLSGRGHRNDI